MITVTKNPSIIFSKELIGSILKFLANKIQVALSSIAEIQGQESIDQRLITTLTNFDILTSKKRQIVL